MPLYKPKESLIVNKIINYLENLDHTWCFKVHGGAFQTKGIPDIIGCHKGQFFALEVKRPGGKTSPLQDYMIQKIEKANGVTAVVVSLDEVKNFMETLI